MALDSKSVTVFAGLLALLVVGAYVVGRGVLTPEGPARPGPLAPLSGEPPIPQSSHPQLEAGRAAFQAGRLDEAKTLLAQVPESDVGYLQALHSLGDAHNGLGEHDEAMAAFETVLEYQPENPFVLYSKCNTQIVLGQHDAAELTCLRVIEIQPGNTRARYTIGLIRVAQGRLAPGVDAYLRAVKQQRDGSQLQQAAVELNNFSKTHPDRADPHFAMAVLARLLKSHEAERKELESYLELAPDGVAAGNAREKLDELTKMGF